MHLTYHDSESHTSAVSANAETGAPEIEVTPEMIETGAEVLDELLRAGSGLRCSPTYAVREVYLAMEKRRVKTTEPLIPRGR